MIFNGSQTHTKTCIWRMDPCHFFILPINDMQDEMIAPMIKLNTVTRMNRVKLWIPKYLPNILISQTWIMYTISTTLRSDLDVLALRNDGVLIPIRNNGTAGIQANIEASGVTP